MNVITLPDNDATLAFLELFWAEVQRQDAEEQAQRESDGCAK